MARKGEHPRRDQFIAWLDTQTDPEAWLTKTYREIGEEMVEGETVDPSVVRAVLAIVIADRLKSVPSAVLARKTEYRKAARGQMTPDKVKLLTEWRAQDPPVPVIDCAYRLDMSFQTVMEQCKKLGISTD